MKIPTNLGISSISNKRQPRYSPEQARPTSKEETNHEIQEHGVVEHNQSFETDTSCRMERVFHKTGQYEQHIEHDGLHCVEPDVSVHVGVSDAEEVEAEEEEDACKRRARIDPEQRIDRLQGILSLRELLEEELPVLDPVEQRQEVGGGSDDSIGGGRRFTAMDALRGYREEPFGSAAASAGSGASVDQLPWQRGSSEMGRGRRRASRKP
jgi:hypothetical protein